jgi:hypothetical protein
MKILTASLGLLLITSVAFAQFQLQGVQFRPALARDQDFAVHLEWGEIVGADQYEIHLGNESGKYDRVFKTESRSIVKRVGPGNYFGVCKAYRKGELTHCSEEFAFTVEIQIRPFVREGKEVTRNVQK